MTRCRTATFLLFAAFLAAVVSGRSGFNDLQQDGAAAAPVVVCYVGTWAYYRPGHGKFEMEHIDAKLCTHLVYAFVGVFSDGRMDTLDGWLDLPSGLNGFNRFLALRKKNPSAKFLVAVGGWNQGSATFSAVAGNEKLRKKFVKSAADFVEQYGFDGLDVDWEYPGLRGGISADKDSFVELLADLHREMSSRKLLLTAAVSVGLEKIEAGYNVPELTKHLDLVNLMAYDLHGSWDRKTGMNAGLRAGPGEADTDNKNLNVEAAVQLWLDRGAEPSKLVLGLPLYGRTFQLADPHSAGVGAPAAGPGNPGPFTGEAGTIGYHEVCARLDKGELSAQWDEDREVPYASKGDQWISYDNTRSLQLKTEFALELGLAGVMVWSLETDDFRNECKSSGGAYPLMRAVQRILGGQPVDDPTSQPEDTPTSQPEDTPTSQPKGSTTTQPAEPTTEDGALRCSTAGGYERDPVDCSKFYYCESVGQLLHQYPYDCPAGLYFDEGLQVCNWPAEVKC